MKKIDLKAPAPYWKKTGNAKPLLSEETMKMIGQGYGCRTESYEGSGERDALDVCVFEICDMGNIDILRTMFMLYGGDSEHWRWIMEWVRDYDSGDLNEIYYQEVQEALEDVFENDLPIKVRYALWLADEEAVMDFYGGQDGSIDYYDVSDAVVLSDLGYDGTLFGFERYPTPITRW